ncbi:MAG: DHH family phosphoesterase [Candidatus Thorarchaeota archaeon]|nr:DHH family phosphoesterase [Candidatus Thorarchaeota archaeon]
MNLISLLKSSFHPVILGHHNADPDAVCSMIAVADICRKINPKSMPKLACDDVSRLSTQVLERFAPTAEILETVEDDYDLVIIVDTNSQLQLGPNLKNVAANPERTLVIDHHEPNPELDSIAKHAIVRSDRYSACEIIVNLYDEVELEIESDIANLLLTGMLFDTRRFLYADKDTLVAATKLMRYGADYQACMSSLVIKPSRSERIARLKAAGRLQVHNIDNWIIVTSRIKAFEASACRGLIGMGADVAIVSGSPSNGDVRLSSRSTVEFYEKTGVNLGSDVMEPLGELIEGKGGGHPNAAGANGKILGDKAASRAVQLIRDAIKRTPSPESDESS